MSFLSGIWVFVYYEPLIVNHKWTLIVSSLSDIWVFIYYEPVILSCICDLLKTLSCLSQPKCSEVVDVVCKYLPHHANHFADVQKKHILQSATCAMCLWQDG